MGWNKGYALFEAAVIEAYNGGSLNKDALSALMEPYRGTDIDSGGSRDLRTQDGKDVLQVCIETWGLEMPTKPSTDSDDDWEVYYDSVWDLFYSITDTFDWR